MHYLGYAIALMAIVGAVDLVKVEPIDTVLEKYGANATLQCLVEDLGSYEPMQWYFHGEKLGADDEKHIIDSNNGSLTIVKVLPDDVGEYICKVELANGQAFNETVKLASPPYVNKFDKSKNLVQGDPLELKCTATGYPQPVLTWFKDDEPVDQSDPRLKLSEHDGVENGTLRLDNLQYEDRADYTCVATNINGADNSTILVRVKDKLAALWPFLGICAEVAILVIIIFVYENRRSKKLEELDAREEADHLTNSHTHKGGDEVRQRK